MPRIKVLYVGDFESINEFLGFASVQKRGDLIIFTATNEKEVENIINGNLDIRYIIVDEYRKNLLKKVVENKLTMTNHPIILALSENPKIRISMDKIGCDFDFETPCSLLKHIPRHHPMIFKTHQPAP